MANSKKSAQLNIERQIIEEVAKRPMLFIVSHPDYKDKNKKENGFLKIAEDLNCGISGPDVLTKWTNLRSQYMAYLRKLKLPTGTGRTSRPYFRHAKLMMFCKENLLTENIPESNLNFEDGVDEDGNYVQSFDLPEERQTLDGDELLVESPVDTEKPSMPPPRQHCSSESRQKKRQMDEFEKNLIDVLKPPKEVPGENEFDIFCKSLAPKLRKLAAANPKRVSELQFNMNKLIFEAEQELL